MPRVLLIKTSSLGDVVHNLPVVGDLVAMQPALTIDWVVEEAFAAIPRFHPCVSRVLPVAIRRWRRAPWRPDVRAEICRFLNDLRGVTYDAIIDTQGLLKSAWIARAAKGVRHGLDWSSSREPLACFYDHTYRVPWGQHAVERNRSLAAQTMGYALATPARYGIAAAAQEFAWLSGAAPYAVLLHATSAERKLWPEASWVELGRTLAARGVSCVLPWGAEAERLRSQRVARQIPQAIVPERMDLAALAALLAKAQVVVGTDTGLTHLAGALGVPTVGLYCSTDPAATGLHACALATNLGGIGVTPVVDAVVRAVDGLLQ
jgi:heptosyltransferase-1